MTQGKWMGYYPLLALMLTLTRILSLTPIPILKPFDLCDGGSLGWLAVTYTE